LLWFDAFFKKLINGFAMSQTTVGTLFLILLFSNIKLCTI